MLIILSAYGIPSWLRERFLAGDIQVSGTDDKTTVWIDEFNDIAPQLKVIEAKHDRHEPKPSIHQDVTGIYQRRRGKKHAS
jgi:hypothetical protein